MAKCTKAPRFRRDGFTLIELMIVIVIMAILALILTPTIMKVVQVADNNRSQAFIQKVTVAAGSFKSANDGRYPGQEDVGLLAGSTPQAGPYTGSQLVAARLFGYPDSEIDSTGGVNPTNKYLHYRSDLLVDQASRKNSLADGSATPNAMLYFPSRLDVTAPTDCYKWDDNSAYVTEAGAETLFNQHIVNTKLGANVTRREGGILIIGTGANDRYFEPSENDDLKSWDDE